MGLFKIGGQRVGIELPPAPVLDDEDQPTYTEYNEPITADPVIAWVDNAGFEIQRPTEVQGATVTTSEMAWAFLPVADGVVPAVVIQVVEDEDTETTVEVEVAHPVQFFDADGKPAISANLWLWHNGLRYAMRGDAVLEQDIRGRHDHVFCVCERETT